MATVKNKKREPLAEWEVRQKFPKGIWLRDCQSGICLVSADKVTEEQWWVDFTKLSVVGSLTLPSRPEGYGDSYSQWVFSRNRLTDAINKVVFGINSPLRLYAL